MAPSVWPAVDAGQTHPTTPQTSIAILQIRALEGEGAVVGAGRRSTRGIVLQVTDETGRPVEGAAVSFRLPSEGSSGVFLSGLKSEIAMTGSDGRASVYGIQWNSVAGPVQIRVTAVKGAVRAGILVTQYLSDTAVAERDERHGGERRAGGSKKWLWLVLAAAGAGTGAALGLSQSRPAGGAPSVVTPPTSTVPPTIGAPTISVGRP